MYCTLRWTIQQQRYHPKCKPGANQAKITVVYPNYMYF